MILFPPEAKTYFDEKANSLIAALKPLTVRSRFQPLRGSVAHRPVTHQLTNADIIGHVRLSYADWLGRFRGFEIHEANIHEFLSEEDAKKLEEIADNVARRRELQAHCGTNYVLTHLVDWVRRRRLQEPADNSWTADLFASLTRDICDQTILIPLEGIQIEISFKLGQVTFHFFTESSFNEMLQNVPEESQDLEELREYLRKRYQGRVYTRFQCTAEKNHAQELASYQTDKALEVLKFFNPAALEIRAQCFLGRMGQVTPAQQHAFQVLPNNNISLSEEVEPSRANEFVVNKQILQILQPEIGIASDLLRKTQLTDLEERTLEAISHFAHGVTSPSSQDRLLHALVAVESLLLRDHNEPVQSQLGYRVALLATSTLQDRKKARRDFLKGYSLRSQFVHHGAKLDDVDTANRVLFLCWSAMIAVIRLTRKFDSKKALLDSLEDEQLAPQ